MGWSRAEQIIQAGIDGETYDGAPHSRLEALLIELINKGGGGGTTNYNSLENLPTIDGTEIKGEVADDILKLVEPFDEEQEESLEDIITDDKNEEIGMGGSMDEEDDDD